MKFKIQDLTPMSIDPNVYDPNVYCECELNGRLLVKRTFSRHRN
jgi:hypothetical protein